MAIKKSKNLKRNKNQLADEELSGVAGGALEFGGIHEAMRQPVMEPVPTLRAPGVGERVHNAILERPDAFMPRNEEGQVVRKAPTLEALPPKFKNDAQSKNVRDALDKARQFLEKAQSGDSETQIKNAMQHLNTVQASIFDLAALTHLDKDTINDTSSVARALKEALAFKLRQLLHPDKEQAKAATESTSLASPQESRALDSAPLSPPSSQPTPVWASQLTQENRLAQEAQEQPVSVPPNISIPQPLNTVISGDTESGPMARDQSVLIDQLAQHRASVDLNRDSRVVQQPSNTQIISQAQARVKVLEAKRAYVQDLGDALKSGTVKVTLPKGMTVRDLAKPSDQTLSNLDDEVLRHIFKKASLVIHPDKLKDGGLRFKQLGDKLGAFNGALAAQSNLALTGPNEPKRLTMDARPSTVPRSPSSDINPQGLRESQARAQAEELTALKQRGVVSQQVAKAKERKQGIESVQKGLSEAMSLLQEKGDGRALFRKIEALQEQVASAVNDDAALGANSQAVGALKAQLAKLLQAREALKGYTQKFEAIRTEMNQMADAVPLNATPRELETILKTSFEAVDKKIKALQGAHEDSGLGLSSVGEMASTLSLDLFHLADELEARVAERTQVRSDNQAATNSLNTWARQSQFKVGGEVADAYACDDNFVKNWKAAVAAKSESLSSFRVADADGRNVKSLRGKPFRELMRNKAVAAFEQNVARYKTLLQSWSGKDASGRAQVELEMLQIRSNLDKLNRSVLSDQQMKKVLVAKNLNPDTIIGALDALVPPDVRMSTAITQARLALAKGVKPKMSDQGINGAQFLSAQAKGAPTLVFKAKPWGTDSNDNRQTVSRSDELRNSFLAARLGENLGFPVPRATMASINGRLGLVQECVADVTPMSSIKDKDLRIVDGKKPSDPKNAMERSQVEAMALSKLLIGDTDGHPGNAGRTSSGDVHSWDHDLSFPGLGDLYMHRNMFAGLIPELEKPMTGKTRALLRGMNIDRQMELLTQAQAEYARLDPDVKPLSAEKLNIHRLRLELAKAAAEHEPPLSLNQLNAIMTAPHEEQTIGKKTEWTRGNENSNFEDIFRELSKGNKDTIDWNAARKLLTAAIVKATRGETEWQKYEATQKRSLEGQEILARRHAERIERDRIAQQNASQEPKPDSSTSEASTSVPVEAGTSVQVDVPDGGPKPDGDL